MPIWLSRQDVVCCIEQPRLIKEMRNAFLVMLQRGTLKNSNPLRIKVGLSSVEAAPANASVMILAPGYVTGISAYTVKVHAKYPDNPGAGMPSIQGVIQLFDSRNGELLAIIDSPILTAHRTAAAAMVATDTLARRDSRNVAIIGAGVQGDIQLRYLRDIRDIDAVYVYDVDDERAQHYAERWTREGLSCRAASSVRQAVASADIVISATWARSPILYSDMIRPGTHITTLGADEPGKVEVSETLIRAGRVVCDDTEMAKRMGILNTLSEPNDIQLSTLSEMLTRSSGRRSDSDITIFGGVGLPFQDLVGAWHVYQQSLISGVGKRL